MDARPAYTNTTIVDPSYYQKGYERRANDVSFKPTKKEEFLNDRNIQKNAEVDAIRIENEEEEKEKKKEKKWTLGGFFRRKCRKDADDSDESGDENRKGFLARRKSKRDRRKARGKSSANGFDIIIPQQKETVNGIGKTAEELWSGSPKTNHWEPINIDNTNNNCNGPTRYIYRHPGSPEALKAHISRHARRDSNLSRNSSGGSGSLDGRKGRKEVMARVEAKRDQMREESSSDENESYHSNSSLNKDGTRRSRRTERHNKRLSRDDENLYLQERNVKSDFEGRRLPPHCRWISRNYYPDSSDHENLKFNLMNHSATPSPARSPRVRQKQIIQNTSSVPLPNSYPVSTFPPGVHFQPTKAPPNPNFHQKYINAKEAQMHSSQQIYRNRNSEYITQKIPRSNSEHSTNRKTLMDYEQFLSACGSNREKSLSCDQDIHRASYFENDEVIHVQLPIGKTNTRVIQEVPKPNQSPRGVRRISGMNYYDLPQHTLRPYNENGMICNRIDSTSSLPVQPGSYPYQQIPIVQRSASGNSFCNLYENSKEAYYNQNRSNSYQHIPTYINQKPHIYQNYGQYRVNSAVPEPQVATVRYAQSGKPKSVFYWSQNETVSAKPTIIHNDAKDCIYPKPNRSPLPKPHPISSSNLRYYADQNPRSRNPIHIMCNTSPSPEQPYLSDSQIVKPQSVKDAITNASDFWKLKDQENMLKNLKKTPPSKPPLTVHNKPDRSRSSSPRPKELKKWRDNAENLNRKMQKEEYNVAKLNQLVMKKNENDKNNNLDDALNELESIYKSLRLGDEDLIERAERRDMPGNRKRDDIKEDVNLEQRKIPENNEHQRAVPLRRSGVPDKVNDDMAYRRMNIKDKTDAKKLAPSHSYLRSSPALSPIPGSSPILQKDTSSTEPDVTFDDVVFRNFRHANSTLKIQDPQPPFGIPIGPITPAPNSDYLHITPKERFRPSFMSSKTPDVIKDDLAFRNLRKDNMTANLPVVENASPTNELLTNPNFLLQKKRAVRSLSANLYNIMQKENHGFMPIETNNNNPLEKDCEKTQSLTDLTENEGKDALEKRLKELKEEKNAKRAEFFELSKEQRKKEKSNLSWTELANLNGDFENVPQINTSTETLTEESESKKDQKNLSRLRVNFQSEESKTERKFRSPIVELSKYPAAVPSSALYSNPFKEHTPGSPLDESQLEDLLSALAIEAKNASEDLGRQLVELELSTAPKPKPKDESREQSVEKEEVKKKSRSSSSEKSSKRKSLSRSNSVDEKSRSSSLEKRKEKRSRNNSIEKTTNEKRRKNSNHSESDVKTEVVEQVVQQLVEKSPERKKSESENSEESPKKRSRSNSLRSSSSPKERKRSVSFEVVTDLSQILQDVEEQQNLNNEIVVEENKENKDVFQEVYEYNCKLLDLNPPKRKKSQPNEIIQVKEEVLQILEARGNNEFKEAKPNFETLIREESTLVEDISSDIEKEFEKLHDEVDFQAKDKDPQERLDDLIADVTSVVNQSSESYSPRPFPNDDQTKSNGHLVSDRNGSSPSSSSGEESAQNTNGLQNEEIIYHIEKEESLADMFRNEKNGKDGSPKGKSTSGSNSSSENEKKRERIEIYKDIRRREMSVKYGPRNDTTTKPIKNSKRKEDLRGGGTVGPLVISYLNNSRSSENQVPSTETRRFISRRDIKKTDAASGNNEKTGNNLINETPVSYLKDSVIVRETKASRLRAASRSSTSNSEIGSPSPRSQRDVRKSSEKERSVTSSSGSSSSNSLNRKDADKSHKRKSHLNRSHTSEEVYDDIYMPGDASVRRRRPKSSNTDVSLVTNSSDDKSTTSSPKPPTESNGSAMKDSTTPSEKTPHRTSQSRRSPISIYKISLSSSERTPTKNIVNGESNNKKSHGNKKQEEKTDETKTNSTTTPRTKIYERISKKNPGKLFSSADNSPVKKSSTDNKSRNSPDVFAKRTELLTANTLKMVNRLDEINNKSRRSPNVDSACATIDNPPLNNTVISNIDVKIDSKTNDNLECKNVPVPDENTAKNHSSSINRRNSRQETKKIDKSAKIEVVNKPSILKKKLTSESFSLSADGMKKSKPVSILKRKSLSQDESHSRTHLFAAPPVTFSPSVLDNERRKRQGILKKRRSLDENEVLRRRSYSPDGNIADFKPILKNQRRSSMEELVRRSKSPESAPQSILKRKSSKEEEVEEVANTVEVQGILKRKSSVTSSGHQHVKISESVIMAAAVAVGEMQINENVRPILKKKSSSEDYTTPDLSLTEAPRPILKKKSSLEVDDEDRPKKPILKSSRKTSLEESEEGKRSRHHSLTALEEPKPILKTNSRPKLSDNENDSEIVVLRRVKPNRPERPYSSSDIDDELNAILNKRRSLEFKSDYSFDLELRRTKSMSSNEKLRDLSPKRPVSVAEKIVNLENFLQVEQMERERRNTPPGSPFNDQKSSPRLSPTKFSPPGGSSFLKSVEAMKISTGAVPKFRLGGIVTRNDGEASGRFLTGENSNESVSSLQPSPPPINSNSDEEATIGKSSPFFPSSPSGTKLIKSSDSDSDDACYVNNYTKGKRSRSISPVKRSSLGSIRESGESKTNTLFNNNSSFRSTDSDLSLASESNVRSSDQEDSDSSSRKIIKFKQMNGGENMEPKPIDEEIFLLQRSGSVSAKTSLFKELEKKVKEEEKSKVPKGNKGINRHREKKLMESSGQRFHTQPISPEEVELAVRNSRSVMNENKEDAENHEDELSSMSLSERVRLFNERIRMEKNTPPPPEPPPVRKRGARFRTQPVTTEEVETAQNQRLSPLQASLVKPPDSDLFGLGILGPKALKEKIYDHANLILRPKSPNDDKIKGILKNPMEGERLCEPKKINSESDSSDSEVKSILKSELSESFQNLKSVLKNEKETTKGLKGILKQPSFEKKNTSSSDDNSLSEDEEKSKVRSSSFRSNLASILQKVEPKRIEESKVEDKASDGESSSSGGREVHKIIKNDAVARRRQAGINKLRNSSSLVKSQSHSSVSSVFRATKNKNDGGLVNGDQKIKNGESNGKDEEVRLGGLRRSTTQPFTPIEQKSDDDMSGASIQERLARLKKSGENDWQKRKTFSTDIKEEFSVIQTGNYLFNETCMLRSQVRPISPQPCNKEEDPRNSPSILADRLGKLETAKDGWRKRVQPSDAVRFSVEGKMLGKSESVSPTGLNLQISPSRTPLLERKKRSPKAVRFRSKLANPAALSSTPSSPMERFNNPISRSISAPGGGEEGLFSLSSEESNGPVVSVPRTDDETFTSFFEGISYDKVVRERLEINDEDLEVVTRMKSSQLLVQRKDIKTQKRRATVKNPLKALAARSDLQEYTEVKTGIAEKELKRMKVEKASKNSTLAIEALAGLASQEDFTAISLKKATESGISSPVAPYKELMLLLIKGRRHVQTRLVEPVASSINAGDCFVLITPTKIFHYIGEYSNVIEKSRGAEISSLVQQKSDLGCMASSVITIGGGGRATSEQIKEFWSLLGADLDYKERKAGHPDEDELFESALIDTNMVYEVVNDELVPIESYWGSIPKIEILDPNKILVFDFGSEFYVWNGKNGKLQNRKIALKLARELWEEGFDYSDCDICPVSTASHLGNQGESLDSSTDKAGPVRPPWALFAKITQNMETVLFREKFLDWPDYSRVIRRSKKDEENEQIDGNGTIDVKPCDAKAMLDNPIPDPDLILEGSHLGRGLSYYDEETRRCFEVSTHDVKVWHISEYEYSELPISSVGQFHMEDSYVVRWHYMVTITGRELSGLPSKHLTSGRDRFAYFCWQGQDSPINDKGAAACLTVELDREHGPQIRVVQGFEPPAFLNLFKGSMVVHKGRRDDGDSCGKWRLFVCRGETDLEAVLFEVPCSMRQLRSAGSYVLVGRDEGIVIVWHGWKSPEHTRKIALTAAKNLKNDHPPEFQLTNKNITIREEIEGTESRDFLRAVGGDNRQLYYSLLDNDRFEIKTPRLFHLSSVSGEFLSSEVVSPYINKEVVNPYPFIQNDLYSASQPALFLLDTGDCLWLWQGWWEGETGEGDRGSGSVRFQAERRAAMSTALSYWDLKYGKTTPKAYLVWAGLEPLDFTNLFAIWTDRDDIAEINIRDGKKPGEMVPVKAELAGLTQSTYPLAQLLNRPLPDGVNPTSLEDYLEPQCFLELFSMTKDEFFKMPLWKKKKLKQDAGLF